MSYDVSLLDKNNQPVKVKEHSEGGEYAYCGIDTAELNITYNYTIFFYKTLDPEHGLRVLNGQRAGDWITKLEEAVKTLGIHTSISYWDATPGNAGYALSILLQWAKDNPDAMFEVW